MSNVIEINNGRVTATTTPTPTGTDTLGPQPFQNTFQLASPYQRSTVMYTVPKKSDAYLSLTMNAGVLIPPKDEVCDPNAPDQDCYPPMYNEPASYGPDVMAYLRRPKTYPTKYQQF